MPLGQFLESSNSSRYHWILKLLIATYKSEIWEQNCVWLFYYFNFERNHYVLKSNSPFIFLNKHINFNKSETESEMEKLKHCFRETNLVLQLIYESEIENKTVMSWRSRKKKEGIFCNVYFVIRKFFLTFTFYLNT